MPGITHLRRAAGPDAARSESLSGVLLFVFKSGVRTLVYIDGFNLYYRALRGTPHRWLNLVALTGAVLPNNCQIVGVNYYTARVAGHPDPAAPARQHAYLRALATLPEVTIHYGKFLVSEKWSGFIQPPDFRPAFTLPAGAAPVVARVRKTEEKGSDVNLAVHLVRDAFLRSSTWPPCSRTTPIWSNPSGS